MKRKHSLLIPFAASWLVLLAAAAALAQKAPPRLPPSAKFAVFLLGQRVGRLTTTFREANLSGRQVIRIDADTVIKVQALGEVEQTIRLRQYVSRAGDPVYLRAEVSALGRPTLILARFFADRVECDVNAGGQKSKKTVPIPKGVKLIGDKDFSTLGSKMKIGDKETMHFFEPTSLSIQKVTTEVVRREKLALGERTFDAFVVRSKDSSIGETTQWLDDEGELLQTEAAIGMKIVREDFGALKEAYSPPLDLIAATSVKTEKKIEDPRAARFLKVRLSGIPERDLVISDARQKAAVEGEGDSLSVTFQIQASDPRETAVPLAAKRTGEPMLQDAPYLGIQDPEIRGQAKEIVGTETDRAVIARKLRDWVHKHITTPKNAGILRSAKEIMANRDGVCREYATLFAALSRAAGIPTRVCGGILYHEGAFYYHAWVECRLTDSADGWVPFDPTLEVDFVDATHVKLAQGDVTDMFAAVRVVGRLKAEILEYR